MSKKVTSKMEVPFTIVGAMADAGRIIGESRKWNAVNETQKYFIEEIFEPGMLVVKRIREIESIASFRAEEIAEFLRKRGSNAGFAPLRRNEMGIASMLDLLVEWKNKGENIEIETPQKEKYKGVRIGERGVGFYSSRKHNNPIACLGTKTVDKVFVTMLDEKFVSDNPGEFALHNKIKEMKSNIRERYDFGGIRFPKVDLEQAGDAIWLSGINTISQKGDPVIFAHAYQKNRLRMNEFGARFQSEFRGSMVLGATMKKQKEDHIINKPFLCWIEKTGIKQPIFVAYVTKDDWRDPGDIRN